MVTPTVAEPVVPQVAPEPNLLDIGQPEIVLEPAAPVTQPLAGPTPAAGPEPTPAVATPSAYQPQDELAVLRRQVAEFQADRERQATEAALTQESQQVYSEALARGLSDEDARWFGQRYHVAARRSMEEQHRLRQEQMYMQSKQNAATAIGREYGVDPSILLTGDSPQAMRQIADREKRYIAQDARLKALEQARIQPQTLDNGSGSRAGGVAVTPDNIDQLWLEQERLHPGAPNPYDAAYRRLLGMS